MSAAYGAGFWQDDCHRRDRQYEADREESELAAEAREKLLYPVARFNFELDAYRQKPRASGRAA